MKMRNLRKARQLASAAGLILIAASFLPLSSALAQATGGGIKGLVTDQAGAVVQSATVVAKNQETGVQSPAYKSSSDGLYVIHSLIPGKYTLTVESPNFKKAVYTDIDVRLGIDSVIDVALQPGGVSETVTVTAATETLIQKDTSQVSSSFEARKVEDLPSNVAGTGIDTLALLAPGVTPGFGNVNGNGTTLSVNGNRARSNNFTIDGVDNNDLSIGGPNYFVDNQDQVAEFQVITNNFSAQYGRNQGAIINIVTKSGTNQYHGSGFWFHEDAANFNSLNNLEKLSGMTGPNPLLYNVFGGTIGGPIKKDRAFFFGSYQGIRTRQIATDFTGGLSILPEDLGKLAADFPSNSAIQAYSKFSYFAIHPNAIPRPDLVDQGLGFDTVTIGGHVYHAAVPQLTIPAALLTPTTQNEFSGRGDVKVTQKDNVWGRYLWQKGNTQNGLLFGDNGFGGDIPFKSQNLGATWDRQISSRSLNEFNFAYSRLFVNFGGGCSNTTPGCVPDPSLIDQAFTNIAIGIRGDNTHQGMNGLGPATNLPQGRTVEAFQFRDIYSRTMGKHSIQVGADIRRLRNNVPFLPNVNGSFNFTNAARFAANDPRSATLADGKAILQYNETDQFYFFQDDFKFKDNLTLNLGLRYENTGQPINLLHDLTVTRESNPQTALWDQSLPLSARTEPKVPTPMTNFAPRFGFAYTPRMWKKLFGDDATVIRGGYSIAYDPAFYNIMLNVSTAAPVVFNSTTLNAAPPAKPVFPVPDNPFGQNVRAFATGSGIIATNLFDPRFFNQTIVNKDFHSPYAEQWSFGIQRQINRSNVFEIRYLGTHGVGLFQQSNPNPQFASLLNGFSTAGFNGDQVYKFPGFPRFVPSGLTPLVPGVAPCVDNPKTTTLNEAGQCNGRIFPAARVITRFNGAQSIYHSLQTRYNGRIGSQLNYGFAYTFSKALDNASEIFSFQESANAQDPFNTGRAERSYSGFDRRHAISFNIIWDVPFYKDQKGWLGHIAGGWQVNTTWVIASGLRYTPRQTFNGDLNALGFGNSYTDILEGDVLKPFVGSLSADPTQVGIFGGDIILLNNDRWAIDASKVKLNQLYSLNELNLNNVLVPTTKNAVRLIANMPFAAMNFGSPFGDAARNAFVGPRLNQMNAGIFKNIRLKERLTLQLRLEAFNALNHPNPGYGLVSGETNTIADNFIDDAGSTFNRNDQIQLARRVVQLGVRILF
jgi:outer membrane receptor protein involved in Fe transport